jgi:hypothetical protein
MALTVGYQAQSKMVMDSGSRAPSHVMLAVTLALTEFPNP